MAPVEYPEPRAITSELEVVESRQLSLSNAATVGTARIFSFTVTTTVRDVRKGFIRDGRDPDKEHEAVIVVLCFEFGTHKIDRVTIKIDVDEADVDDKNPAEGDKKQLLVRARYPKEAKGQETSRPVTKTITASTALKGLPAPAFTYERSETDTRFGAAELISEVNGELSMVYKLSQDANTRAGVPHTLACAVLLQTDGLPFELSVEFTAPLFGRLYRARPKIIIGKEHLWERRLREAWEDEEGWRDFDAEKFQGWIKRRTENRWAETADYTDAGG
jgi:hypothetical protein